jgi:hypothetical protein
MSSTRNTVLFLFSSLALVGAAGLAVTACSSSSSGDGTTDAGAAETAAPKPRPDSGPPADTDSGTKTPQQCYQDCLNAHPTAKAAYQAVDTCWANKCNDPCLDKTGTFDAGTVDAGDAGDAGMDAGDAGDGGPEGLCGTAVGSGGDMACDQCTTTFCCSEWATCYTTNHDECVAIDECLGQCP